VTNEFNEPLNLRSPKLKEFLHNLSLQRGDRAQQSIGAFFISERDGSVKRATTEFSYFAVIFEKMTSVFRL
jgi:hypothetical protein